MAAGDIDHCGSADGRQRTDRSRFPASGTLSLAGHSARASRTSLCPALWTRDASLVRAHAAADTGQPLDYVEFQRWRPAIIAGLRNSLDRVHPLHAGLPAPHQQPHLPVGPIGSTFQLEGRTETLGRLSLAACGYFAGCPALPDSGPAEKRRLIFTASASVFPFRRGNAKMLSEDARKMTGIDKACLRGNFRNGSGPDAKQRLRLLQPLLH